jgi:protease II
LRIFILQPTLKGGYVYYSKRGPGDDYWNMYRLPLQQQQQQQNKAASRPAAQHVGNLAEAVQAAAAAVQNVSAAGAGAGSLASSQTQQQPGSKPSNQQQQQQQGVVAAEQLVLDENSLSAGHSYWDVYEKEVSPDGSRIAFTYDTVGDECYSLQVSDGCG